MFLTARDRFQMSLYVQFVSLYCTVLINTISSDLRKVETTIQHNTVVKTRDNAR